MSDRAEFFGDKDEAIIELARGLVMEGRKISRIDGWADLEDTDGIEIEEDSEVEITRRFDG